MELNLHNGIGYCILYVLGTVYHLSPFINGEPLRVYECVLCARFGKNKNCVCAAAEKLESSVKE